MIHLSSTAAYLSPISIWELVTPNQIFSTFEKKIAPKRLKVVADYYPRGNVHTVVEIDSEKVVQTKG